MKTICLKYMAKKRRKTGVEVIIEGKQDHMDFFSVHCFEVPGKKKW